MSKICAIITGGTEGPLTHIEKADFVIACDKGFLYAQKAGVSLNMMIGDFDSYAGARPQEVECILLPVEKDDTDTHAAAKWVLTQDFDQVWIYCALGGRLDHLAANLQTCTMLAKAGLVVRVFDTENNLIFIHNRSIRLEEDRDYHLSLLAMTDTCEHVCLKHAKWELSDVCLTNDYPLGVSNEWDGKPEISVGEGVLMISLCKGAGHLI